MKILITGASGFIGWELAKKLVAQGNELIAYGRRIPENLTHDHITWIKGDFSSLNEICKVMAECEEVYHLAGIAKMQLKRPKIFYDFNVGVTERLLEASLKVGIRRFLFTSTCGVFGKSLAKPIAENDIRLEPFNNDYDLSKYMAEQKVHEYVQKGLDAVIVNPSRVFGPGQLTFPNAMTRFIDSYFKRSFIATPGSGEAVSNFAFIEDVVKGHILAMKNGKSGHRYIIGGHNLSYNQLLDAIEDVSSIRRLRIHVPKGLMLTLAQLDVLRSAIMGSELTIRPSDVSRFCNHRKLSSAKATDHFGYEITDLNLALTKTIQFLGHPVKWTSSKAPNTKSSTFFKKHQFIQNLSS